MISLKGGHYYLTNDLTFTTDNHGSGASIIGGGAGTVSCLHLNGYNITSTASPALFISSGIINMKQEAVEAALKENGFEIVEIVTQGDWVSIVAR